MMVNKGEKFSAISLLARFSYVYKFLDTLGYLVSDYLLVKIWKIVVF